MPLVLHSYWRSGAAYRVRIALNLKGLEYSQVTHDLRTGAQRDPAYKALNPQALVPALQANGQTLIQSLAILEWLEELYPEPPLLPEGSDDRAIVRAMMNLIACDIHPLNNLRVLKALKENFAASQGQINNWIARWVREGFTALEQMISQHGGTFAFGNTPTLADCCLVPQVYSARRFSVDLAPFPRIVAVAEAAQLLPAVAAAHPDQQPDAD